MPTINKPRINKNNQVKQIVWFCFCSILLAEGTLRAERASHSHAQALCFRQRAPFVGSRLQHIKYSPLLCFCVFSSLKTSATRSF